MLCGSRCKLCVLYFIHGHIHVCGLFTLILPFYFLLYHPHVFLKYMKSMVNLHNSCNQGVDASDDLLTTGYEPQAHDFNETSGDPYMQLLDSPLILFDKVSTADPYYDDATLEDMLHQVHRAPVYHSLREDSSVSLSSSSMSHITGNPVGDRSGQPGEHRSSEAQIRTLLDDQEEQILADCQARTCQHEFQAARAEEEQRFFQGQPLQQELLFREAHQRSLTDGRIQSSFRVVPSTLWQDENSSRIRTLLEISGRVQEWKNEVNRMNDSEDFQDAESIRSGHSHVTSRPMSFPPHPIPAGMKRHSFVSPSRKEGPPSIWDTHGISETSLQIHMHLHQLLILKN